MRKLLLPALGLALAASLSAQLQQTLPAGYMTANGDVENSWPWNNTNSGHRCMWIYDSSHIQHNGPILIRALRWRASFKQTTWTGGTHPNVTINMSTSPLDYQQASATYASNHGQDMRAVFQGTVTMTPDTHPNGRWFVEVLLATPFLYDPAKGDLVIDIIRTSSPSGSFVALDHIRDSTSTWTTKSNRIQSYNTATSPTGSVGPYGAITQIEYVPASGLYSAFTAAPMEGPSPLLVQFTDKTFTSAAGGITSWAWDFDGDNKIDATVQNPSWTFTGTGWDKKYSVSLTTTDGVHAASKVTLKDLITVNPFPIGKAESFGSGSTTQPIPASIGLPAHASNYSSTTSYGFYFQTPAPIVITALNVPNPQNQPLQSVWFFKFPAQPTGTYAVTAADLLFYKQGAPSNTPITLAPPVVVQKDTWIGVIGSCHGSTSTTLYSSYGTGPHPTTVLGMPATLTRLYSSVLLSGNGLGSVTPSTGTLGRIEVAVAGNVITPVLTTEGQPYFGNTPQLDMVANLPGAQVGVLLLAGGKLPGAVTTPFGDLLVLPPFLLVLPVPNGTGKVGVPIPNDSGLAGVVLDFQGAVFDLTKGVYGMTNGNEWTLGQK